MLFCEKMLKIVFSNPKIQDGRRQDQIMVDLQHIAQYLCCYSSIHAQFFCNLLESHNKTILAKLDLSQIQDGRRTT